MLLLSDQTLFEILMVYVVVHKRKITIARNREFLDKLNILF